MDPRNSLDWIPDEDSTSDEYMSSPAPNLNGNRIHGHRGFSLIEITIALSILVLALSILVENQGFAAFMTQMLKIRIATMLAEEKMIEAQLQLELEGWKTSDIDEDGDFDDLGREEFRGSGSNLDLDDEFEDYRSGRTPSEKLK